MKIGATFRPTTGLSDDSWDNWLDGGCAGGSVSGTRLTTIGPTLKSCHCFSLGILVIPFLLFSLFVSFLKNRKEKIDSFFFSF